MRTTESRNSCRIAHWKLHSARGTHQRGHCCDEYRKDCSELLLHCQVLPIPCSCHLCPPEDMQKRRSKMGVQWGSGSRLVGRTAGQAEGAPRNQMEAIFFYGVTQSNGKTLGVRDRKKVYCPPHSHVLGLQKPKHTIRCRIPTLAGTFIPSLSERQPKSVLTCGHTHKQVYLFIHSINSERPLCTSDC